MKYLLPFGGVVDHRFGIITSPGHRRGAPIGIQEGMQWAADNEAYTREFDPDRFFPWLDKMRTWIDSCLFVAVPDVVGDAEATLLRYKELCNSRNTEWEGYPTCLVAQDGLKVDWQYDSFYVGADEEFTDWIGTNHPDINPEDDPQYYDAMNDWRTELFVEEVDAIFIGGTTEWKLSQDAIEIIRFGQKHDLHIHIGRINYWGRYLHFAKLKGSERFTCDGTVNRFIGRKKAIKQWLKYMENDRQQIRMPLFGRNRSG